MENPGKADDTEYLKHDDEDDVVESALAGMIQVGFDARLGAHVARKAKRQWTESLESTDSSSIS